MYNIAKTNNAERQTLFRNTAQKMGMNEGIIEKDFWVCLTMDYLFHICPYKDLFIFKGGTSLSKAYGLIQRFSEDIDLILDWRTLGYSKDEPWKPRSKTKQDHFNSEANERGANFLQGKLLPVLKKDLSDILGKPADIVIDDDPQVIDFNYPHIFDTASIMQSIRLEIGALAAWTPSQEKTITPYAAEQYPQIFRKPNTQIKTATAERTLWEKLTILHQEANRPQNRPMPKRYSRHYYDLYCIAKSAYVDTAFKNPELLKRVVEFKMKFYPRAWAQYENVRPGSIKLVPPEYNLNVLRDDYKSMKTMIFGEYPSFDELINFIAEFQKIINIKLETL